MIREALNSELKTAMKSGDKRRVETIRLVNAAVKDRDIEARGQGKTVGEQDLLSLLQKLIKSRQESIDLYRKADRQDLVDREAEEVAIIRQFLPEPMSPTETDAAIDAAIEQAGAASIKDMGKVVAALKANYAGRMDFAEASAAVKRKLAS